MRPILPLLLALATALPLALPAAAQAPAAPPAAVQVLQDAAGDVAASTPAGGAANPTPRLGPLDLLSASVLEQEDDLQFTLAVASLDPSTEPPMAESAFYLVRFLHGDIDYALQLARIKSQEAGTFGVLSRYDPAEDRYYAIDYVPVAADVAAATLTATVPRDLVVDSHGAKPYPGTSLAGFWAESQSFMEIFLQPLGFFQVPPPTVRDRMPDAGNGTVPVPILLGPVQAGSARLSSQVPTRQSNGEATTVVFRVEARNAGDHPDRFRLSAAGVPQGWQVSLPEAVFPLDVGAALAVPVLATVPFTHTHGSFQSFVLRMESATDLGSHADLELGIRYPRVPQPAGHHPILALHGARFTEDPTVPVYAAAFGFNMEYGWMNALEDDPGDQRLPVPSDPARDLVPGVPATFRWTYPLAPDLAIGLDFDPSRPGAFRAEFEATGPLLGARLSGELAYYLDSRFDEFGTRVGGERTLLAILKPTPAQDLQPGAKAAFAAEVVATPAADLVPYRPKSALVLELNLTGMRPDTAFARDPPRLHPGANLELPLFEFHDPVDAAFSATPHLAIAIAEGQDRGVNPGRTAVYRAAIRLSPEAHPHPVRLSLTGTRSEWARLLEPAERPMEPGETWDVAVAVQAPADARPLDAADIVLRAEAADDSSLQALVRLYATVTTGTSIPDEADLAARLDRTQAQASPGAGVLSGLAVLALAMWAARRR